MKLTEKKIKQIILEELQSILENPEQDQQEEPVQKEPSQEEPSQKLLPNVVQVEKIIQSKIKQPKEYNQLLQIMLKFKPEAMSDSVKITVLRQLKELIIELLK